MARHQITIDGRRIPARRGETLLDAALSNGIDLPHDCRSGYCGSCCVRLVSGAVQGGEGAEPGVVHACQCRVAGDAVLESRTRSKARTVDGVLTSLRPLSSEVMEVGIHTDRALPHHPGQYAQVRLDGYPSRPFSFTHALSGGDDNRTTWFHIRRMKGGRVTSEIGGRIRLGHRVTLTGPFGSAHFRPQQSSRLVLVATNTGFAPIWSVAVAALRENPERRIMIIAGGRSMPSLYMLPALGQLARFRNVLVVPVCSGPQIANSAVQPGRPTDYLPRLLPSDVLYACGAPAMVDAVRSIAAQVGAICHADPFVPVAAESAPERPMVRAMGWLGSQIGQITINPLRPRKATSVKSHRMAETRVRDHHRS